MAANLRAKLPESDSLLVNDRNVETLEKFTKEISVVSTAASKPNGVEACSSAREVAEKSVSSPLKHAVRGAYAQLSCAFA